MHCPHSNCRSRNMLVLFVCLSLEHNRLCVSMLQTIMAAITGGPSFRWSTLISLHFHVKSQFHSSNLSISYKCLFIQWGISVSSHYTVTWKVFYKVIIITSNAHLVWTVAWMSSLFGPTRIFLPWVWVRYQIFQLSSLSDLFYCVKSNLSK